VSDQLIAFQDTPAPLTDRERELLKRIFSDFFEVPGEWKTSLVAWLEANPPILGKSSLGGQIPSLAPNSVLSIHIVDGTIVVNDLSTALQALLLPDPGGQPDGNILKTLSGAPVWSSADWVEVVKGADQSDTTGTLANDSSLFFTAVAGAVYDVGLYVPYVSPIGGGTPDLKCDLGEDTTARGTFSGVGMSTTDTAQNVTVLGDRTATLTFGTAATLRMARITGWHVGNGGTFRFRWAQNTAGANATTVKQGALLRYRRIS
jgi:hypothetical protein